MPPDWCKIVAQWPMLEPSSTHISGTPLCCIMQEMDDLILGNCLVVSQAIGARADGKVSPLMSGYHAMKWSQLQ